MRIIISPAKKMKQDDGLLWKELPAFLDKTEQLYHTLKAMDGAALQKLWKCNDQIAAQNVERLQHMDLRRNLSPAILAYEGIQYQYMAASVFSDAEFDYLQEHLRILSGFYGVLKPFDGVTPYRLEMQSKLKIADAKDLYAFWGAELAERLFAESDCIVNLASKEYSQCITRHQKPGSRIITCVFGEKIDGKVVEKGTLCKMARGEMVRWMAEQQLTDPEQLRNFEGRDHRFSAEHSNDNTLVFLKKEKQKREEF